MNARLLRSLVRDLDQEDIVALFDEVDMGEVLRQVGPLLERELQPHLEDIQERAEAAESPGMVREQFASMPEEEQQVAFDEAVADLVMVLRECREQPDVGFARLKRRLRDPDVLEPLLLVFDNPEYIDPEYADELKEFAAMTVRWAGLQIFPEIYTDEEIAELEKRLDPEG